jgi:PhnB protein
MVKVNPYLMFNGNCAEAMAYYEKHLGGKIGFMMKYSEAPPMPEGQAPPAEGCAPDMTGMDDLVMHASLQLGDVMLMASDSPPAMFQKPQGISVTLNIDSVAEAERIFKALADRGTVTMPLGETFWAERFGTITDRFGIPWMINCEGRMAQAA